MQALISRLRGWARSHLTLRMRLAVWSAVLLLVTSLILVIFINLVARASVPRLVVSPLVATPPPEPTCTHVPHARIPFAAPGIGSGLLVKGWAVQQVQKSALRQVLLISVGGILLILVVGSIGIYLLTGYALYPVHKLARWVASIDVRNLSDRFAWYGPNDEVKQLADAFDSLLDRLEQSLEQQERFISDAAHELRTPLATLRTTIEVLRSDPDATLEEYRKMSEKLERTISHLERLTESLLLLTRSEQQIAREEVFLWPLLEDLLLDMGPLAQARGVRLSLEGESDVMVEGDGSLLLSVFRNLVRNAILYNRRGGSVTVRLAEEPGWAVVSIEDTGVGIPKEEIGRIFDRFYRGRASRSRHRDGTGLGLALVAHIVRLHRGKIQVESTPGVGSTFTVRLPL